MRKSRLKRRTEKQNRNTIILGIVGIVVVLYLLFKFGVGFLVGISLFFAGRGQNDLGQNANQLNFIAPPILNPLPVATNSAQILLSGQSLKDYTVLIYLNNKKIDEVSTDDKGSFSAPEDLQNGDNEVKVKAEFKDKQSEFSNVYSVAFKNSKPNLDISSPSDGAQFKKDQNTAQVSGKTDSGVTITVNGFWALIDENNNFSYNLSLKDGDNEIKVVATDQAGNQTDKTIKVNYSQ